MDQMDIPFEDDETSIARTSNRSASELAILEAQMQLDNDLVQVAEAKARATSTRVLFLKAEASHSSETKSRGSDARSRGSRHRVRIPPPVGATPRALPPPLNDEDNLERDLSAVMDEYHAEQELGRKALNAEMLAQHTAQARVEAEVAELRAKDAHEHSLRARADAEKLIREKAAE